MSFGVRLREERKKLKLNQLEFAAIADTTKQTLYSWETDKTAPPVDRLAQFAQAGVDVGYVITGVRTPDPSTPLSDEFIYINRMNVEVSAGHGAQVDQELVVSKMAFRKDWIKQMGLDRSRLAILRAKGDSMSPTIEDGATLLVETYVSRDEKNNFSLGQSASNIKQDGIYIIRLDGHLMVKRLQRDGFGGFIIISDNKTYSNINVSPDDAKDFCIAGRVVWAGGVV